MSTPIDDLGHTKSGTAILMTCIVQTLAEKDPTFQARFLNRLAHVYEELRNAADADVHHEIEMLAFTHAFLTSAGGEEAKPAGQA
jgi:hypothetical protein